MRLKLTALVALGLLLSCIPAWAHRIDEYLQATILSLESNRAHASMRLIPGVMVAPFVIATIDTNHDGLFSEPEKHAYAERVLRDLSITVDGTTAKPQLDSWVIPDASQLRDGLGEIRLEYHLDLPPTTARDRSLIVSNHHLNDTSVYLMNVEVPQDRGIRIVDQKRNARQSTYELDYAQTAAASPSETRADVRAW